MRILYDIWHCLEKEITNFLMSWSSGEKIILLITNKKEYWMVDFCKECVVLLDHWRVTIICAEDYQSYHLLCFQLKLGFARIVKDVTIFNSDDTQSLTWKVKLPFQGNVHLGAIWFALFCVTKAGAWFHWILSFQTILHLNFTAWKQNEFVGSCCFGVWKLWPAFPLGWVTETPLLPFMVAFW